MQSRPVLVTGGAGFVGSHTCKALMRAGFLPITYDNLSNGRAYAVKWGPFEQGQLDDTARLASVLAKYKAVGVLHFAAFIEAGESVRVPERFFRNNVGGTLCLLEAMQSAGVDRIVFSSTAAVYGEPRNSPIQENHPLNPTNPYGHSKRMVEQILADVSGARDLRYCALRYFNAAGADPDGELSENHVPETHLIPLAIETALGRRPCISVYGDDYSTRDGTCIRDYVHVSDLANAHVLALDRLLAGGEILVANLGTGRGHSVLEVIREVELAVGLPVRMKWAPRRAGDPAVLVADPNLAIRELGWRAFYPDLNSQVMHAAAALGERPSASGSRP